MSKLSYITRDFSSPQGKPRVWFCCHPADYESCFAPISDEILKLANCAIWYESEPDAPYDEALLKDDIGQMQLVVIPITAQFLREDSRARRIEFAWASEQHIPILPLMQEHGLEDEFNAVCGALQFLEKHNDDGTAVDYRKKLKNFLDSVLVGEELAAKVRAAFDAYVFLSYRKKDRKYAQELMRLIHKNSFCRDIAIWYDEFLVPGENFNEAIIDALKKSSLFALLVTPNLVNEKNYVMTVEYPMALREGKFILPAEAVPTNRARLEKNYAGIPACTDAHDAEALEDALKRTLRRVAIGENDRDPEHLFFIGLAYLNGIDVEVDHQKATELLQAAAELGLPEAAEKLADMYWDGFGVARDYATSLFWKEKQAECLKQKLYETGDPEVGDKLWMVMLGIAGKYYSIRQPKSAEAAYQNVRHLLRELNERFGGELVEIVETALLPRKYAYAMMIARCYTGQAMCFEALNKLGKAFAAQEKGTDFLESFYLDNLSDLADLLQENEKALSEIEDMLWLAVTECYEDGIERYKRYGRTEEAQTWEQRQAGTEKKRLPLERTDAPEDMDEIWREEQEEEASGNENPNKNGKRTAWAKMSDEEFWMYAGSKGYSPELKAELEERIAKLEGRYEQTREIEIRYTLSDFYSVMKSQALDEYMFESERYDQEKEELQRDLQECTHRWMSAFDKIVDINLEYSECMKKAAAGGLRSGRWKKKAEKLAKQAQEAKQLADELYPKMKEAEQRQDTARLASLEKEWEQKEQLLRGQRAMWVEKIRQWDAETLALLLEYVVLIDREYEEDPSEETEKERIKTYDKIAALYDQAKDAENASLWYRKEIGFLEECISQTQSMLHYYELADACYSLGILDQEHPDKEMLRRALKIRKELYRYMPDPGEAEEIKELERLCAKR